MDREISVTYSEKIVRASVRKQWLNLIGVSGFVLLLFLIALFLFLLFAGDWSWLFGFGTASLVIYGGILVFGYFRLLGFSISKFRRKETPTATFQFNNDGILVIADTGKIEIAWKLIEKILQTPEVWVILVPGGGMTLPTEKLDAELRNFILDRASHPKNKRPLS